LGEKTNDLGKNAAEKKRGKGRGGGSAIVGKSKSREEREEGKGFSKRRPPGRG